MNIKINQSIVKLFLMFLIFNTAVFGFELQVDKKSQKLQRSILNKVGSVTIKESFEEAYVSDKYIAITTSSYLYIFDHQYQKIKKIKKPIINYSNSIVAITVNKDKVYLGYNHNAIQEYNIKTNKFSNFAKPSHRASDLKVIKDKLFIINLYRGYITIYSLIDQEKLKSIRAGNQIYDFAYIDKYFTYIINSTSSQTLNGIDVNTLETGALADFNSIGLIKMALNSSKELLLIEGDTSTILRVDTKTSAKQRVPKPGIGFSDHFGICGDYIYSYGRHILSLYDKKTLKIVSRNSHGKLGMSWMGDDVDGESIEEFNDSLNFLDLNRLQNISCHSGLLEVTLGGSHGRVDFFELKN